MYLHHLRPKTILQGPKVNDDSVVVCGGEQSPHHSKLRFKLHMFGTLPNQTLHEMVSR